MILYHILNNYNYLPPPTLYTMYCYGREELTFVVLGGAAGTLASEVHSSGR